MKLYALGPRQTRRHRGRVFVFRHRHSLTAMCAICFAHAGMKWLKRAFK